MGVPEIPGQNNPSRVAAPAADRVALDQTLGSWDQIGGKIDSTNKLMLELIRHFDRTNTLSKAAERSIDSWGTGIHSILKDTANLEYSMKRIAQLQRARATKDASRTGALALARDLKVEYQAMLKILNTSGEAQGRHTNIATKAVVRLTTEMKRLEGQTDATWDPSEIVRFNKELAAVAKNVDHVAKAMNRVQVDKMTTGFSKMGQKMDEAFDGQLGRMLRRIPGVQGYQNARQFGRSAAKTQDSLVVLASERKLQQQAAFRASAQHAVRTLGPGAKSSLRGMGYEGSFDSRKLHGRRGGALQMSPGASAKAGGSLEQMTVKTLSVEHAIIKGKGGRGAGRELNAKQRTKANRLGAVVEGVADSPESSVARRFITAPRGIVGAGRRSMAAPDAEALQAAMGSGGIGSKLLGKAVSPKLLQDLIAKGGGSAAAGLGQKALGLGSGLMEGASGFASKAAVPLAIVKGIMDIHDKVAMENQKIQEALGGAGIHGVGRAGVGFNNTRTSLLSTGLGNAAWMGQGLPENMAIMKNLSDSGLAVGGSLRGGKVNLGRALEEQTGVAGAGFHGSVMKNAVYNGKNLGMNQDSSVRLTLKLMEKFGKTTEATQEFFLKMDDMMQSSGVTAAKYIDIVDAVTDEFSDMNKALGSTLAILNNLGKSGRLTGKAMEDMIKTLQAKNQMSTAQRMYSAKEMLSNGGAAATADALTAQANNDEEELKASLRKFGISEEDLKDISGNRSSIALQLDQKGLNSEDLKGINGSMDSLIPKITSARAQAAAFRSGDTRSIAAATSQFGETGVGAAHTKLSTMQSIAKSAGMPKWIQDGLLRGDPKAMEAFTQGASGLSADVINQGGVFQNSLDLMKTSTEMGSARRVGAGNMMGFGRSATSADLLLKTDHGQDKYNAILRNQRDRGKVGTGPGAEKQAVDAFIKQAHGTKEEQAALAVAVEGSADVFNQMMDQDSPLTKALSANTDALAARAKAEKITAETRPMADTFAQSFAYLFDKVTNLLAKLVMHFDPSAMVDNTSAASFQTSMGNIQGSLRDLNPRDMGEAAKARYAEIEARIKSHFYDTGAEGADKLREDELWLAAQRNQSPEGRDGGRSQDASGGGAGTGGSLRMVTGGKHTLDRFAGASDSYAQSLKEGLAPFSGAVLEQKRNEAAQQWAQQNPETPSAANAAPAGPAASAPYTGGDTGGHRTTVNNNFSVGVSTMAPAATTGAGNQPKAPRMWVGLH